MNGILVVNKPKGITSHDVVNFIRRKFKIKKVGHAGTLDPMATGVMILLLGSATKSAAKFINDDKEYIAGLFLGKSTDTQDAMGKVLEEKPVEGVDEVKIRRCLSSFSGSLTQTPPMISAKKKNGVRLYDLARSGKTIKREPCRITVHEIELLDVKLPEITLRVRCSKGTYVRTLCEDIGRSLGYPAHMSSLVRSASGRFSLEKARDIKNVGKEHIIPV